MCTKLESMFCKALLLYSFLCIDCAVIESYVLFLNVEFIR